MPTYIVGYDRSPAAEAALELARALAATTGAQVLAAYIYPWPTPSAIPLYGPMPGNRQRQIDAHAAAAASVLDCLDDDVIGRAIPADSVPAALHALARDEQAALLAVGATHRGRLGRIIPGSVGERALHGATCPVLVVPERERPRPINVIGVAYDGRPESRRALRAAQALVTSRDCRLILIGALAPDIVGTYTGEDLRTLDLAGVLRPEALERAAERLRHCGVSVETRVVVDAAGAGIANAATDVDVLVCGSRGYGPARSVMLGSVSRYLVDHAPCPVLVIPRSARTRAYSLADSDAGGRRDLAGGRA